MPELRILFQGGPGDAFTTLSDWRDGRSDTATSHVAYSRQFYDACREVGAAALVTCSFAGREGVEAGEISAVHRPNPLAGRSGLAFYGAQVALARQIIGDARRFQANVAIVFDDVLPVLLEPLRRRGVAIVQSLHCVLWRQVGSVSRSRRAVLATSRGFYRRNAFAILSASDAITEQVRTLAGGATRPIVEFLPHYTLAHYGDLPVPDCRASTLEVAFVGRVEENKGALDLVEVAERLRAAGARFRFHVCGTGSALEPLRQRIRDAALEEWLSVHGWCDRERLREILGRSHLAIVPTRSEFVEGFNQAVVEAVLARRPPIASSVCPGARYVAPAAEVVEADRVEGYVDALLRLARDRGELERRVAVCEKVREPFLRAELSYRAALLDVLGALAEGRPVAQRLVRVGEASPRG